MGSLTCKTNLFQKVPSRPLLTYLTKLQESKNFQYSRALNIVSAAMLSPSSCQVQILILIQQVAIRQIQVLTQTRVTSLLESSGNLRIMQRLHSYKLAALSYSKRRVGLRVISCSQLWTLYPSNIAKLRASSIRSSSHGKEVIQVEIIRRSQHRYLEATTTTLKHLIITNLTHSHLSWVEMQAQSRAKSRRAL